MFPVSHGRVWKLLQRSKSTIRYVRRSYQLLLKYAIAPLFFLFSWKARCIFLVLFAAYNDCVITGSLQIPSCGICIILPLLPFFNIWSTTWLWFSEATVPRPVCSWRCAFNYFFNLFISCFNSFYWKCFPDAHLFISL